MPLPRVHRVVQDSLGNVVPQVLCSVLLEGTGTLATLWQDDAGTIPMSNPMTSDATYGSFDFYVQPAHYDLTFTKPGYTFQPLLDMQVPQDDLTLGTMAQQDASAVAITGGDVQATRLAVGMAVSSTVAARITYPSAANQYGITLTPSLGGAATPVVFTRWDQAVITGTITTTDTTTAYNTTSDIRLKHAIAALTGALDVVQALKPVAFRWRADDSPGHGFIAQEVAAVVPAAVTGAPDALDAEGNILPMQIDHSRLIPWLTSALQEAVAQVQALAARVASLEEALGVQ